MAPLSFDLVLMPGMENLISALMTSGVELCVSISHSCKDVRLFSLLLLQDMVEACSFQPIIGQVFEAFMQWMVWHYFIFSLYVRSLAFFHVSRGSIPAGVCMVAMGVLFMTYGYEAHFLCLVEFIWVLAARTCSVFKCWSHCPSVHCGDAPPPQYVPGSRISRASFLMPLFLMDSIHERRESSVAPKKINVLAYSIA